MNKINVSICSCPVCYPQGARLFKELDRILCANLKEQIVLTGSSCESPCMAIGARVDGEPIAYATAGDILRAIRRHLRPARVAA